MEIKTEKVDDRFNVNSSEDILDLDNLYVTNFVKSESSYLENEYEDTRLEESKEKESQMSEESIEKQKPSREKYFMRKKEEIKERRNKVRDIKVLQRLLEVETVKPMSQTNYFIWETLFLNFLKMDENYTPFLDTNKTWPCFDDSSKRDQSNEDVKNLDNFNDSSKHDQSNEDVKNVDNFNDSSKRDQSNEDVNNLDNFNDSSGRHQSNEDVNNLHNLITTLASYGPEILNKNITNKCTSISQFFKQICDFYGIQYSGLDEMIDQQIEPIHPQEKDMPSQNPSLIELRTLPERAPTVPYRKLRKSFRHNGSRNYQEFYLELRTSKYEDLMGEDSGIKFNGLNINEDENIISGIENGIVIDWLEGIDRRLPDFIEHKYSSELQTTSLYKLQGQISQNLDSHISEMEQKGDGEVQIQFCKEYFDPESEANGIKEEMDTETEIFDIISDSNKLKQVSELGVEERNLTTVDFTKIKENISSDSKVKLNPKIETEEIVKAGYSCEKCGKCFQQIDLLIMHKKENHIHNICLKGQISQNFDSHLLKIEDKGGAAFQIQTGADNVEYKSEANGMEDEVECEKGTFDMIDFSYESNSLNPLKELEYKGNDKTTVDFNKTKGNILSNSKPKLKLKIETEEMVKVGYPCEKCGKYFQQIGLLIRHKKEIHTGDKKYTCDHCGSAYKSEIILRIHVKTTHLLDKPPKSNKKSSDSEELYKDISSEESYKDISTAKSYTDISSEKSFKDISSEKLFKGEKNLENYIVIHTGKKTLKCDECDKSFQRRYALKIHKKMHSGIAEYICDVCSKEFYEISKLVSHKAVHSDDKYSCVSCGKCFKRPSDLRRHTKVDHNGEKLEKVHTCEQCGKSFDNKPLLVEHIRVHTGEKPFLCEVCSKSFAKEVNLKVHKRLHTKQFPFKCDMCNSAKNELIQLKKHKLTVHGIK